MDQPALLLASTSPYRRDLLARLGLPFTVAAPACDEDAVKAEGLPVEALTARLARLKAASVPPPARRTLVIGSDQAAEIDGAVLGKPGTPEAAEAQLARLAGREHRLVLDGRVDAEAVGRHVVRGEHAHDAGRGGRPCIQVAQPEPRAMVRRAHDSQPKRILGNTVCTVALGA